MNVIFLDKDGVLNSASFLDDDRDRVTEKVKILSQICQLYNAKVVISSGMKELIDEETLESDVDWVNDLLSLLNNYNIEVIGRTPTVRRRLTECAEIPTWKDDEIRLYLFRHPEIKHYCVIDDDDMGRNLDKVRKHLVVTEYFNRKHPEEEGLLSKHMEEVGEKLKVENEVRRLVLKYKR